LIRDDRIRRASINGPPRSESYKRNQRGIRKLAEDSVLVIDNKPLRTPWAQRTGVDGLLVNLTSKVPALVLQKSPLQTRGRWFDR
jgi:hypothetical protein